MYKKESVETAELSLQGLLSANYREKFLDAVYDGDVEQVKQCLKLPPLVLRQCFITSDDNQSENLFFLAVSKGHANIVKQLFEGLGKYPEIIKDLLKSAINENGKHLLHLAIENSDIAVIQQLLLGLKDNPEVLTTLVMGAVNNTNAVTDISKNNQSRDGDTDNSDDD